MSPPDRRRRDGVRWRPWAAMALVLAVALAVGAAPDDEPTRAERARSFAKTVKCPKCRSESVADSEAPVAVALRREIERRFDEGQNEDQVRRFLIDTQGESVLLQPPKTGLASLVWVLPVAALVLGAAGLAVVFGRWRRAPAAARASGADRDLVAHALARTRPPSAAAPDDLDPHGEGDGR